jgi:anti-anti-sigma regulatory factor
MATMDRPFRREWSFPMGQPTLRLTGAIDESAAFGDAALEAAAALSTDRVRVELDEITRISAAGLGRLEFFLGRAGSLKFALCGVPPSLLAVLGRTPLGATAIESVWLPMVCRACGAAFEAKAEYRHVLSLAEGGRDVCAPCACGSHEVAPDPSALLAALALPCAEGPSRAHDHREGPLLVRPAPATSPCHPNLAPLAIPGGRSTSVPMFLGGYEILRRIGEGGMGVVFEARHRGGVHEGNVAIKVVRDELSSRQDLGRMFREEIRIGSSLRHPNVVSVLEVFEEGGACYLVMEFVRGASLLDLLLRSRRGGQPISLGVSLRIVFDLLLGLEAVHTSTAAGAARGLIHRDVSPANILVDRSGVAKLADFGIAEEAGRASPGPPPAKAGKLAYMAPELLEGGAFDQRVDLFAAAVVLWELAFGERPFRGLSPAEMRAAVAAGPRRPPLLRGVPRDIERECIRALAAAPDIRHASARDFAEALEGVAMRTALRVATREEIAQLAREATDVGV